MYNDTFETEEEKRKEILDELMPNRGEGTYLQGPIYFDYGQFTTMGECCYANFNFTVLDTCPVTIGDNVFFGPNCTIATPVTISSNCWIASNVVIAAGVTIGEGCVIGAGSVVTKDIPANSLAAGNPCRVIRPITEEDSVWNRKELL